MPHADSTTFRNNFPGLESTIYLSSCSLGARSRALDSSMVSMLDTMSSSSNPWHQFEEQVSIARQNFAKLIGADPDQIAVMPNASVAAYQVASTFDWSKRPTIVTSPVEFPSIAHVWQAQEERGAQIEFTKTARAVDFRKIINNQSGLVSVPMASYSESRRLPVAEIVEFAHDQGAKVFVDAYQTVGVENVDVNLLNCDYLVAGTTKYLLGLPGVAFMYARNAMDDECMPQLTGWFGRVDPFAFDARSLDFPDNSRRYETGTPSVPALYAANAGLRLILDLDMDDVREHISNLVDHACDRLTAQGEQLLGARISDNRGAHIALVDENPEKLQSHLANKNISVSPRGNVARLSFHYYNTMKDADTVCDEIAAYRALKPGPKCAKIAIANTSASACNIKPKSDLVCVELDKWFRLPKVEYFPLELVLEAYRKGGKEFVEPTLLEKLDKIRTRFKRIVGPQNALLQLRQFLDVALDKFDGRYEYTTYCALDLLPMPTNAEGNFKITNKVVQRDNQLTQLIADLLHFELQALRERKTYLPDMRPEKKKILKRIRLGINSVRSAVERMGLDIDSHATDIAGEAERFCQIIKEKQTALEEATLQRTMLPVYTVHDEHLFIRILQSFETNFSWIAIELMSTIKSFENSPDEVAGRIKKANCMYHEAAKLFPVLATMQPESFGVFREYTDGASAIQSRNYKRVESLCRAPDEERRESLAYHSVPEVREKILAGQCNIDAAFQTAKTQGNLSESIISDISKAMAEFSATLQGWRQTHYRLAVKMLGDQRGTGKTDGTPYLSSVRDVPVFLSMESGE